MDDDYTDAGHGERGVEQDVLDADVNRERCPEMCCGWDIVYSCYRSMLCMWAVDVEEALVDGNKGDVVPYNGLVHTASRWAPQRHNSMGYTPARSHVAAVAELQAVLP